MEFPSVTRRVAISRLSKAAVAAALFGPACTSASEPTTTTVASLPSSSPSTIPVSSLPPPTGEGTQWARIQYGVATPYILYKGGRGVLVDTGKVGIAPDIETTLSEIDLTWTDVEHVVLTHSHRDNVGALPEVAALATDATLWAGEADIADMPTVEGRVIQPVAESERISDLTIVATPGHTAGHISVLDEVSRVLIDGDLVAVRRGGFYGPSADTSDDPALTQASMRKLGHYQFDVVLVARGEPILEKGDEIVRLLAELPSS